jgi:hypothetical protein
MTQAFKDSHDGKAQISLCIVTTIIIRHIKPKLAATPEWKQSPVASDENLRKVSRDIDNTIKT